MGLEKVIDRNSLETQRTREVEGHTLQRECKASTAPKTAESSREIRYREHRYLTRL